MNFKLKLLILLLIGLFFSGCSSIDIIEDIELNLTDTYFKEELICFEDKCSLELLHVEQTVACYKGCKLSLIDYPESCFDTCELFYQDEIIK